MLQRDNIQRLAVFRALQLGDMLCAVPALRALRAALPDTAITLVGLPWARQFASRYPHYIDDFIAFPGHAQLPEQAEQPELHSAFYANMRSRQFDLALQMHGSGELSNEIVAGFGARASAGYGPAPSPHAHATYFPYPDIGPEPLRLLLLAHLLGAPVISPQMEFPITRDDRDELASSGVAQGLPAGRYICIHPGARWRDKCWPPARFAQVADQLAAEFSLPVVLTGSAKEADLTAAVAGNMRTPAIDAASPISIGAMAALMSDACLLICNDTGVSHIAAGMRLSSVVIFSKADIARWAPLDTQRHRCLWDPDGARISEVLGHARELLAGKAS